MHFLHFGFVRHNFVSLGFISIKVSIVRQIQPWKKLLTKNLYWKHNKYLWQLLKGYLADGLIAYGVFRITKFRQNCVCVARQMVESAKTCRYIEVLLTWFVFWLTWRRFTLIRWSRRKANAHALWNIYLTCYFFRHQWKYSPMVVSQPRLSSFQ